MHKVAHKKTVSERHSRSRLCRRCTMWRHARVSYFLYAVLVQCSRTLPNLASYERMLEAPENEGVQKVDCLGRKETHKGEAPGGLFAAAWTFGRGHNQGHNHQKFHYILL